MSRLSIALSLILASAISLGALTSQVNTYTNGNVLTANQLNSEFGNIYATINALDDANLIAAANINPAKISSTIDGDGIDRQPDGSLDVNVDGVTVSVVSDELKIVNLPGSALATGAVGSTQIANGGVAKVDLAVKTTSATATVGNVGLSNSTGAAPVVHLTASVGDLANNSLTIATNGGPVVAMLVPGTSATESYIECEDVTTDPCTLALVRDGVTTVGEMEFFGEGGKLRIPPGGVKWLDVQAAGTYAYKITFNVGSATALRVLNVRLLVYEL